MTCKTDFEATRYSKDYCNLQFILQPFLTHALLDSGLVILETNEYATLFYSHVYKPIYHYSGIQLGIIFFIISPTAISKR